MKKIFVGIAQYIADHPECKKASAYTIYNAYFSQNPYSLKTLRDVKTVVDYIDNLKMVPQDLLNDSLKGAT